MAVELAAGPEHTDDRAASAVEITAIGLDLGDAPTELLGRRLRIVALLEQGDLHGADREVETYARASAALDQPLYGWYVPLWRGMRALAAGRLGDVDRYALKAEELGAAAHSGNAELLVTSLRWWRLLHAGDGQAALGMLEAALGAPAHAGLLGVAPQFGVAHALALAAAGRHHEARALVERHADDLAGIPRDSEWLPVLAQLAEIAGLVEGHALVEWTYRQLEPLRHACAVEGIGAAIHGSAERHLGLLVGALGWGEAATHFEAALETNRSMGAPLLVARTLRDAALVLDERELMEQALQAYQALGIPSQVLDLAARREEAAESTRPHGRTGPSAGSPVRAALRREGEVWALEFSGTVARVRDTKGVRDLARLLAQPGRAIPALDLVGAVEPARGTQAAEGLTTGVDLGEVVDAQARAAYRQRIEELEEELEDADADGDPERSSRLAAERDQLLHALAGAYGLGGRPRRSGDPAERARATATWRIRSAVERITAAHPELGRHLARSVRTGRLVAYEPDEAVTWVIQP